MSYKHDSFRRSVVSLFLTFGIASIFITLLVFGYRTLFPTTSVGQVQTEQDVQPWPSVPLTFTPVPTATAESTATPTQTSTPVPTPTPISLPVWNQIEELGIVSYTLSTDAEAQNFSDQVGLMEWLKNTVGTDRVRIRAVGIVRVGIDLSQIKASDTATKGKTVSITLPEPKVLGVELLPEKTEVLEQAQRIVLSEYSGLEIAAMSEAKVQLEQLVTNNPSMLDLAKELTQLRLTERLRSFGFSYITIKFRETTQ